MSAKAVAIAARVLEVEFGSVLELRPESRTLVLRAGVGWRAGAVGRTVLPADPDGHAGYVLRSTGQVVVEDLATDTRFGSSPLLAEHGVVSSLSVLMPGKDRSFGILGVHAARRRDFTIHDTHFLPAIANVLATAIDRARMEDALRRSEEHFRSLIENASDIVTVVGDNGVFRYASPSVARVLGYEPGDLLERSAFDYMHPDDIAAVAGSARPRHPGPRQPAGGAVPVPARRPCSWSRTIISCGGPPSALEEAGYQVLTAADGLEALEALRQTTGVRLVFSDLVMPRLGGRALYDAARREGHTVPFPFASGYADPDRAAGLDPSVPLLHKPWTTSVLLGRVREILDREAETGSGAEGGDAPNG